MEFQTAGNFIPFFLVYLACRGSGDGGLFGSCAWALTPCGTTRRRCLTRRLCLSRLFKGGFNGSLFALFNEPQADEQKFKT
ncbi:hypothetical protein CPB85DRAFT_645904 [Mucidula mucida]|nr:hypothetical protein CPB85DRAFT_645904 [Mucidula mucida]